ncbi:hypothetical protein CRG98_021323 [Punica granatum]|uniref:RNase H type-1 domain-containing protein n=1 Tax=Punica granatum TaxID=22663 RepID=A0A2I0JPR6_PUNGR|nr:hypothetical protein CRG98_021323 [Punica granatum]
MSTMVQGHHPGKQANLHEVIKNCYMEHSKRGRDMEQREGSRSKATLQLEASKMPAGPDWYINCLDAAWNSSRSCLSRVLHQLNNSPSLSWFQISNEDTSLQVEARAVLLALIVAADRGFTKIWLRCDALLLVEAIFHPHTSPWEIRNIVSDINSTFNIFYEWLCSWIPRSDNTLAHDLS